VGGGKPPSRSPPCHPTCASLRHRPDGRQDAAHGRRREDGAGHHAGQHAHPDVPCGAGRGARGRAGGCRAAVAVAGGSPAWAGSWPDPPPESKATRPRTAAMSARRTTRCPRRSRSPGLQATSPASASSAQPATEFTSFLGTWRARRGGGGGARGRHPKPTAGRGELTSMQGRRRSRRSVRC